MTLNSPIKSSSRAGRFKKKLVSESVLLSEAPVIRAKLAPFQELFTSSKISQADFTACYLLTYLACRFPGTWPGAKTNSKKVTGIDWRELPFSFEKNVLRRLEETSSIYEIFANFALKSTPLAVNRAILKWSSGHYQLEQMFRIPGPREVLNQQKNGKRCVSTIIDERISGLILNERDALSFTMHDLIHADHFYHHNECYRGQLGFYGLLDETFEYFDLSHQEFAQEFEYLIADMNAYAIHLLKCLKSAMLHYFNEDYFSGWINLSKAPTELRLLNTTSYEPEIMDSVILKWLDSYCRLSLASNRHLP